MHTFLQKLKSQAGQFEPMGVLWFFFAFIVFIVLVILTLRLIDHL